MTKKSFTNGNNPAVQFISNAQEEINETVQAEVTQPTEGYKLNPMYIETRSKRVTVLMQPSLHDRIKQQADYKGMKVNDYIHKLLDENTPK